MSFEVYALYKSFEDTAFDVLFHTSSFMSDRVCVRKTELWRECMLTSRS